MSTCVNILHEQVYHNHTKEEFDAFVLIHVHKSSGSTQVYFRTIPIFTLDYTSPDSYPNYLDSIICVHQHCKFKVSRDKLQDAVVPQ